MLQDHLIRSIINVPSTHFDKSKIDMKALARVALAFTNRFSKGEKMYAHNI